MIDYVLLYRKISLNDYLNIVNSKHIKITDIIDEKTYKVKAYLKNLVCIISQCHIVIKGSLSEYYFGNRYTNFTRQSIEKAISKLKCELSISLDEAYVFKIEISRIVNFKRPINDYLNQLEKMSYTKKKNYPTGLVFSNKSKSFIIYDKKSKLKHSKIKLNKQFDCIKTMLKIEIRLKKRVKHHLKSFYKNQRKNRIFYDFDYKIGTHLQVKDLYDRKFYNFLCDYWFYIIRSIKTKAKYNNKYYFDFINTCENSIHAYR